MSDKLTHTPGPWKWCGTQQKPKKFCYLSGQDFKGVGVALSGFTENKANAHLIAAAPELLEALKTLLEASRELDQSATHDGLDNCKAITQARAAIRKAEEGAI